VDASPTMLPASGAETPVFILPLAALGLSLALIGAGLMLRRRQVTE
jgi:LPXTG-motif cell wall-anchored protein